MQITSRLYELYLDKYIEWALFLCLFVHLVILPLFEHPTTFDEVPYWVPIIFEFVFLLIYAIRLVHAKTFQEKKDFFGVKKNIVQISVIVVSVSFCYIETNAS
jgi:hypothetical protein